MLLQQKITSFNFKSLRKKIRIFCYALIFILANHANTAHANDIDPIVKSLHINLNASGNTSVLQLGALATIHDLFVINTTTKNYILLIILLVVMYGIQQHRENKIRQTLMLEIDGLTAKHNELLEKYKHVLIGENEKPVESQNQRLLKKALTIVDSNIDNPLFGVEKMALEMGMSRTSMHRKIKSITGFSPSEFIRDVRMKKAAQLLINQTDSVAQISLAVGFEDHSYFSKSFKKKFGATPSEYFNSARIN